MTELDFVTAGVTNVTRFFTLFTEVLLPATTSEQLEVS